MKWLGFSGRCNQQQYWVVVALLFIVPVLATAIHLPLEGTEALWLILYAKRLHDIGKTLWWAVGVIMLSVVPAILWGALGGESVRDLILHHGVDDDGHRSLTYFGTMATVLLIQHSFTLWLGVQKGDEDRNRFGEPQKSWRSTGLQPANAEATIWEARLWEDDEPSAPTGAPPGSGAPVADAAPDRVKDARPVFGRRPRV
jgi:uncharacterized membrane protein YhaH (DUF805 family)